MNVTDRDLRQALDLIQRAQPLASSPLLALEQLGRALSREGLSDSPESREWQLIGLLHELVAERLGALRESEVASRDALPDIAAERRRLRADFEAGNIEREAWSAIYYRYLSSLGWSAAEVAEIARPGYSDAGRHLRRRIIRGCHALAERLNERERAAIARDAPSSAGLDPAPEQAGRAEPESGPEQRAARAAMAQLIARLREGAPIDRLDARQREVLIGTSPDDADAYRLLRILARADDASLSSSLSPRLTLLIDQGEASLRGRWASAGRGYQDLSALLAAETEPVFVLLGPPGSGKSVLMRRLERRLALAGLRGETALLPARFDLSGYAHGESSPLDWLSRRWQTRQPRMPGLPSLLSEGRLLLLLDGLNEMPQAGEADYHARVRGWKILAHELAREASGSRMLFSCRELHYSTPLSSPELRVPQVLVEPLDEAAIADYLRSQAAEAAENLGRILGDRALFELARRPYFLQLMSGELADDLAMAGPAALLSAFVRRALSREIARDNPLLAAGDGLLTRRERSSLARALPPAQPYALPERGRLVPALGTLARAMLDRPGTELQRNQLSFDMACELLDEASDPPLPPELAERVLDAGLELGVLEAEDSEDALRFTQQLLQAYFAARQLRRTPDALPLQGAWRAASIKPPLSEVLPALHPADPLPPLPASGWEPVARMAAAMSEAPADFVEGIAETDLPLAGQAAASAELAGRLPASLLASLRQRLAERSRDPRADLRARIAAAEALSELGDSRYRRARSEDGEALTPPTAAHPAGRYPIGARAGDLADAPASEIELPAFELALFPVTNAEFACFVAAGGYEDARWWIGPAAEAWRCGEASGEGARWNLRSWRARFLADPALLPAMLAAGRIPPAVHAAWQERLALDAAGFEAHLDSSIDETAPRAPACWTDPDFNQGAQPVVGVSWFEASAYCRWLSAVSGRTWRLPSEVEWEAAARGKEGRRYAWGNTYAALRANTVESHVRRSSPVGVFVEGDTPEGVADLTGNVWEWTASAYGRKDGEPDFGYPYVAGDGREDPKLDAAVLRVARGGSWLNEADLSRAAYRYAFHPGHRNELYGFRLARDTAD